MDTVGEGEVGVNRESSTDIYILPHVTDSQWEAAMAEGAQLGAP